MINIFIIPLMLLLAQLYLLLELFGFIILYRIKIGEEGF